MNNNKRKINPILMSGLFIILISSIFISNNLSGQGDMQDTPQGIISQAPQSSFDVSLISSTSWDKEDGLPYKQVPGLNLGAVSFEILDKSHVAYLSNSTDEIIITDTISGKITSRFSIAFAPRDFVYDRGTFYVLNDFAVNTYNSSGKLIKTIDYSKAYVGIVRIKRYNNSTYLLLPSGNSLLIESKGIAVSAEESEGWITSVGDRVLTKTNGDNTFTVTVLASDGKKSENTFTEDKTVAGAFVINTTADYIILDVQNYISEGPINIERKVISISLTPKGLGSISAEIKIPNVYYVLSTKDFLVTEDGNLYNMITAPQGVYIFKLTEVTDELKSVSTYPEFITTQAYHFNDHLIKTE